MKIKVVLDADTVRVTGSLWGFAGRPRIFYPAGTQLRIDGIGFRRYMGAR